MSEKGTANTTGSSASTIPWLIVAPVQPYWKTTALLEAPFAFDDHVSLEQLPEWLREDRVLRDMGSFDKDMIRKEVRHALTAHFRAPVDDARDPSSLATRGRPGPQTERETALSRILLANLALWIATPSCLGFRLVLVLKKPREDWEVHGSGSASQLVPHEQHRENVVDEPALHRARALYQALCRLPRDCNLWPGLESLWSALTHEVWLVRFLLLWVALESLYGSDSPQETTFRLSQRAALFLAEDRPAAKTRFDEIKEGYKWRSRIAHGMQPNQMKKLTADRSKQLSLDAESLLRASYLKILLDPEMVTTFQDPKHREMYLDSLVYRR
jgi:hypothetical protein